jgi:hypothetical protein
LDNFFGPNLQPALIEQPSFIFDFQLSLFFQITLLYIVFQLTVFLLTDAPGANAFLK